MVYGRWAPRPSPPLSSSSSRLSTLCAVFSLLFSDWWTLWELAKLVCHHKFKNISHWIKRHIDVPAKEVDRKVFSLWLLLLLWLCLWVGSWCRQHSGSHDNVAKMFALSVSLYARTDPSLLFTTRKYEMCLHARSELNYINFRRFGCGMAMKALLSNAHGVICTIACLENLSRENQWIRYFWLPKFRILLNKTHLRF